MYAHEKEDVFQLVLVTLSDNDSTWHWDGVYFSNVDMATGPFGSPNSQITQVWKVMLLPPWRWETEALKTWQISSVVFSWELQVQCSPYYSLLPYFLWTWREIALLTLSWTKLLTFKNNVELLQQRNIRPYFHARPDEPALWCTGLGRWRAN